VPLLPYCEHGEHGLSDVECVSPIMVDHGSIVHSHTSQNGFIVRENHVIEFPGIQTKLIRFRKGYVNDPLNIVIGCNDMVGEDFEGNALLGCQTCHVLILASIVNAQPAEDGKSLEDIDGENSMSMIT
jgi:hypothetical protein